MKHRDSLLQEMEGVISEKSVLEANLAQAREEAVRLNDVLVRKEAEVASQRQLTEDVAAKLKAVFASRTYRYLVLPLWHVANALKRFGGSRDVALYKRVLVIKPYHVTSEATVAALADLRSLMPQARITLFANVWRLDYDYLHKVAAAHEKRFFSPDVRPLNALKLAGELFLLNARYFDQTLVLIGRPVYQGYRKAKALAWGIGGRHVNVYFVSTKRLGPLIQMGAGPGKSIRLILEAASFWGLLAFFVFLVVLPLQIKKIFRR